ncbi:MAG: hypothetical protein HY738_02550, partial [Bacteroidia bacterium]|nr:hypothetical protein [Bacteroidia bacterium]
MKNFFTLVMVAICINSIAQSISNSQNNALWQGEGSDSVKTNRFVKMNNSARVKGSLTVDSLNVKNTLTVDSIHTRTINADLQNVSGNLQSDSLTVTGEAHIFGVLHIGQNSMSFGGGPLSATDQITSNNGVINLGGSPTFSNIQVGVGTTGPNYQLDVVKNININTSVLNEGYRINGAIVLQEPLGTNNIFVGRGSGVYNFTGDYNSLFGDLSAYLLSTGMYNSFLGFESGYNNSEGSYNTFIGCYSGYMNDTGTKNTYLGYNSQGFSNLTNATAIGSNTLVTQDNSLILGSINGVNAATVTAKVGIGTTTPQKRLEVVDGTTGNSGLRLTSLANSTPQNPNGKALSINPTTGDVILVNDPAGGSTTPAPPLGSVQFNLDNNSFGGNAKFIWDNTNNRLGVGTSSPKNLFHLNGTSGVYEQFTNTATSA